MWECRLNGQSPAETPQRLSIMSAFSKFSPLQLSDL